MQLSQTGTDKNPLQNRIPGITHILQLVMTIPSLISNYAVKVRRQELRAGGNKLSAARGRRRIILIGLRPATFLVTRVNERRTILPTKKE
jgi:hypothetical protein